MICTYHHHDFTENLPSHHRRLKMFFKAIIIFFHDLFQSYLYTSPLGETAAKAGVVINCIHFSPTDHIIAFSGMVSGQRTYPGQKQEGQYLKKF